MKNKVLKAKTAEWKNEKGLTLASVVFAMLALSAVGMGMTANLSTRAAGSASLFQGDQAFYVAEGALQYVVDQYFKGDTDFSDNTAPTAAPFGSGAINLGNGQFWVEYSNVSATSAVIKVTAKVGNSVRALQQQIDQAIPLNYAFASTNNLILSGAGTLNGNVSAGGSVNVNGGFVVNGTIDQSSSLTLPSVNIQEYIAMTSATDTNGTLNISGNYSNNIYATGNVNIQNNANVTGIIVSGGNISIGKSVNVTGCLVADGNISSNGLGDSTFNWQYGPQGQVLPVMASDGNMSLTAKETGGSPTTTTINGLMISNGDINLNKVQDSTLIVNGFMFTHNTSNSSSASGEGNVTINYDANLADTIAQNNIRFSNWKEV